MTDERTNPEIANALFQTIKDKNLANLYELTKEMVRKQKNLTIQEAQWKHHNVSDEAWCILSETLDANCNPEILEYSAFIMDNADKLFFDMEQTVLGAFFQSVVPNQTPEQFKEFLKNSTISDKALAYLVDDGDDNFFQNLSKFHSNEWNDMQESYIDYLQKCLVFMEHLKDKNCIEPKFIHYMLHEIGKNTDNLDSHGELVSLIKKYFQTIKSFGLFEEKDWDTDQKSLLAKIGVLKEIKVYEVAGV